jgi:hypothetical protein
VSRERSELRAASGERRVVGEGEGEAPLAQQRGRSAAFASRQQGQGGAVLCAMCAISYQQLGALSAVGGSGGAQWQCRIWHLAAFCFGFGFSCSPVRGPDYVKKRQNQASVHRAACAS